jgi:hypothetical protein
MEIFLWFLSPFVSPARRIDDKQRLAPHTHSLIPPSLDVAYSHEMTAEKQKRKFSVYFFSLIPFRLSVCAIKDHKLDCYWGFFIILFISFYMLRLNKINLASDLCVGIEVAVWREGKKTDRKKCQV